VFVAAKVIDQSGVRSGVFASRPSHADEEALVDFGVEADRVREEVRRALAALLPDES